MADKADISEIQDKYVPFLKKLISFLEKNKKATPENLTRLKSIYEVFTTAPIREQIDVFNVNKKKLEKWYKNSQKEKMNEDGTPNQTSKRKVVVEDTDSSQGALEIIATKKAKTNNTNSSEGSQSFNPALIAQIKKEKVESTVKPQTVVQPPTPAVIQSTVPQLSLAPRPVPGLPLPNPAPLPPTVTADGQIIFTCASCQFQTLDEQEFMKHTRTDHRSDLSMWCKQCGKCFSNAGVLVSHIKERACTKEEMIYRCGVKDCTFETTSGQTFVHHLRHCHKGSPFIFCVHCQKIFTLPHCLILHMQDDCPYKAKNRRNPEVDPPVVETPVTNATPIQPIRPAAPTFVAQTPMIATVSSATPVRPPAPVVVATPPTPARGRGALMPTSRGRGRGRGRGRVRAKSESSDSDDPDDPSWKPEELPGNQQLRRSGRWAKKVNDVINVIQEKPSKRLSMEEINNKKMLQCPCCDFSAAFKSVLQDHYIAHHKVPNKNACLVCHLKFESTAGFLEHFEDHINGKLPNKVVTEEPVKATKNPVASPVTIHEETSMSDKSNGKDSIDINLDPEMQDVVKNISEANVVDPTSAEAQFVKIPYQSAIHDKNLKDSKLKKFDELKSPNDMVSMLSKDKIKCFFKCVMYGCSHTTDDSDEYRSHLDILHKGKRLHCAYCLKEFFSGESLTNHLLADHRQRNYQCSSCFYRAYSKIHVQIHMKNIHSKDSTTQVLICEPIKVPPNFTSNPGTNENSNTIWPFICAIGECSFQSFDPKGFKSHNETAHRSVSVFFCHYCKVDFISFKRLLNHYRLHGINTFQCNYCIHGSETKDEILQHLCTAHADQPLRAFMRGTEEDIVSEGMLLPFSMTAGVRNNAVASPRPESPMPVEKQRNTPQYELNLYEVVGETYYPKYLRSTCSDFTCGVSFCPEKFENILMYIGHLRNAHAAVNFPCPHCSDVADTWSDFRNHLMCHGSELYACGLVICKFYDWDKNVVTNHLKMHSQSSAKVVIVREPAVGSTKEDDFEKIKFLPSACPFKISDEYFPCFFCTYKSSDKKVMKNHLYSELAYKRFTCGFCGDKFVSRSEIKEHFTKHHLAEEVKCSVHPNPEIENVVQKLLSQKEYPVKENHQCNLCNKIFKSPTMLQQHVVFCTWDKYQPYDCNHCKSSFSNTKLLKFHADEKHFPKPMAFTEVSSSLVEDELALKIQSTRLKYVSDALGSTNSTNEPKPICFVKFYMCSLCTYDSNHRYNTEIHIEKEHIGENIEIKKELRNQSLPDVGSAQANDTSSPASDSKKDVKRYRCGFCIKKLHTLKELECHVESLHPVKDEVQYFFYFSPDPNSVLFPEDKEQYECSYCNYGKSNLHALKKHFDLMHLDSSFKVRGFIFRNRPQSSIMACGYCYIRVDGVPELKRHTATNHPNSILKSIGGFKKPPESVLDDIPNKRMKFGGIVYICAHCGAAYASQSQVTKHSKKSHTRLTQKFTTTSLNEEDEKIFYKCEFCQFTSEREHLETHLLAKHKMVVTCGYCSKRFEFASKLKEHHDVLHKGLPVKYSQETSGFAPVKQENSDPPKLIPVLQKDSPKRPAGKTNPTPSLNLNKIFIFHAEKGKTTRMSVETFSTKHDIFPKIELVDIMKKK